MSLRGFLADLEAAGHLKTVHKQVSPRFEVAALLKRAQELREAAVLLASVKGYAGRVVGNLLATEERFGLALGVTEGRECVRQRLMEGMTSEATRGDIMVSADLKAEDWIMLTAGEIDLGKLLPALVNAEAERATFINAGVLFVRAPGLDLPAFQLVQAEVKDAGALALSPVAPPMDAVFEEAERQGYILEVAVAIGVDPVMLVAAASPAGLPGERWRLARFLKGAPLAFLPAVGVTEAEIVIKGKVAAARTSIGPYACYLRTYYEQSGKYLLHVEEVAYRSCPFYQTILPDGRETFLLMALPAEAWLLRNLRFRFPWVLDVRFTEGGCTHNLVVQVQSPGREGVRELMRYLLQLPYFVKYAIVVDEDIDPSSWADVEWSLVTRVQPDRDLVVERAMGSRLDPSAGPGQVVGKLAIDATRPPDLPHVLFSRAGIPAEIREMVERNWNEYWSG